MAVITIKELQALNVADDGKRISMGESMYGLVRAGADGIAVYVSWRYMVDGKRREVALGTWRDKSEISLKALRIKRDTLVAEVRKKVDPKHSRAVAKVKREADAAEAMTTQQARLAASAAAQARMTVRELFDRWQNLSLRNRANKGADVLRAFNADVFPAIGAMAAEDVRKAHIQDILDTMAARATDSRPMVSLRKKTLADMRQMFCWALERDYLPADPTAVIRKAKLGADVERDRVLTEAELIELFDKLPKSGMAETSRLALLIQLGAGSRIGETLMAHWAHIDFDRRTWSIPAAVAKNGKTHTIALNDFTISQFKALHALTGITPWAFPNSKMDAPVCPKSTSKQVGDRQRYGKPIMKNRTQASDSLELSGGRWTPHDLRRTAATMMAQLGAMPDVIEKCLNHTEPNKIKRIYQRASYEGPMREAWRLLGERLELLTNKPDNVVMLRAA
jgi:integrase